LAQYVPSAAAATITTLAAIDAAIKPTVVCRFTSCASLRSLVGAQHRVLRAAAEE
jgi:hypothetical protein